MPDQLRLEQAVLLGACPVQSKTSAAASKTHRVRPAEPADAPADRDLPLERVQELAPVALLPAEVAVHPVAPVHPVEVAVRPAEVAANKVALDHLVEAADPPVLEGLAHARLQAAAEAVQKKV